MTNYINGVQQVSITIPNGATSATATITAAVGTAFILLQGVTDTQAGTNDAITKARVELTNATTVTAFRNTSDTSTVTVNAVVVDATSSLVKSVQMGTIALTSGQSSNTATISSVTTANTAVALLGGTTTTTSLGINTAWPILSLTNATTVTATCNTSGGVPTVGYCVIEFQGAALNQAVQGFTDTASPSVTTRTHAITSVNVNNSMIIWAGCYSSGTSAASGNQEATLTNGTTVTITTSSAPFLSISAGMFVVEFVAGVLNQNAQRGEISIAAGTSGTASITAVNTANAIANFVGNSTNASNLNGVFGKITLTSGTVVTGTFNTSATGKLSWEVLEFVAGGAAPPFIEWMASFDAQVKGAPAAAQFSTVAQKIQPSPIAQTDWYAFYRPEVTPGAPAAQNSFVAQEIQPSPIAQNKFYPAYRAEVTPWPVRAQYSVSAIDKRTPSPIGQNVYNTFFDERVKPWALNAQNSFIAQEINPQPISQTDWYPVYDPQVKPAPLRASYYAQLLLTPTKVINWFPDYAPEVQAAPNRSGFNTTAQLLPAPIGQNNWYAVTVEVKAAPLNNPNFVTPPIPVITATFTPIYWYPKYAAEVKPGLSNNQNYYSQLLGAPIVPLDWYPAYPDNVKGAPSAAQFGITVNPWQIIFAPTPPASTGGYDSGRERTKRKAKAQELADHYNRLILDAEAQELLEPVIRDFMDEPAEKTAVSVQDHASVLPEAEKIDFEALARNAAARKDFLQAVEKIILMRREEEEFAVLLLAAIA